MRFYIKFVILTEIYTKLRIYSYLFLYQLMYSKVLVIIRINDYGHHAPTLIISLVQ